ncbi:hypothetical protein ACF090_11540 [Streptomyces sp. NPDC014892]|uniref:hypothetical protein n=1 Tax=Streptomyces sp. NPDC014892 TaxID=3364930 RepID=UPI0037003DC1
MVTAADTGDRAAAQALLEQVTDAHHRMELAWADGGKHSDDMRGFVVLPKRWIVERFFAHLMRTPPPPGTRLRAPHHQRQRDDLLVTVLMPHRLARREREPARLTLGQPAARDQAFRLRPRCLQGLLLAGQRPLTESNCEAVAMSIVRTRRGNPGLRRRSDPGSPRRCR